MPSSTSRRARGPTSTARTWRPPWPTSAAVRGASATSPRRPTRTPRGGHEMSRAWIPRAMRQAPPLDPSLPAPPVERGRALLINPFYAKDPHASFGKHVLTPTLALTSVAGATPAPWRVTYWDENLLAGRPPFDPMPEVVGITVHLTFARRAYALAAWYRARGARVILGGLHVLSCPDEAAPHADALAIGRRRAALAAHPRRRRARRPRPALRGDVGDGVSRRPAAAPRSASAAELSHDHQPHRDTRLPQPLRLLLSRHRRAAHAVSRARPRAGRRRVPGRRPALRGVRRQQPRLAPGLPARPLPRAGAARADLERGGDARRDPRPEPRARDGAGRVHGRVHRVRVAQRREPGRLTQAHAAGRRLRAPRPPAARSRDPGERQLRARLRRRRSRGVRAGGGLGRGRAAGVAG